MLKKRQNSAKNDRIIRSTDCLVEFGSIDKRLRWVTLSYFIL